MSPARIAVRVHPGARRDALVDRLANGEWKVAVSAAPEGGRANAAVVELVAELLGVKRGQVVVARGVSSRAKTIEITGLETGEAERRLAAALAAAKGNDGE
jgi:uncharacterized protein YggU (UPF0235/DUF167 family)